MAPSAHAAPAFPAAPIAPAAMRTDGGENPYKPFYDDPGILVIS